MGSISGHNSPLRKGVRRSTGVSPVSRRAVPALQTRGLHTGGTPVLLMGKMPMLLLQRAAKGKAWASAAASCLSPEQPEPGPRGFYRGFCSLRRGRT